MERILIKKTDLGLGLGKAEGMEIRVNHTIGSTDVKLLIDYYDIFGEKLTASPKEIPVPLEVLQQWGYDFSQIKNWVLNQVGATAV